ncbi:MAG: transketolase [Thermodesulfovibrionales bacterium]
MSRLKPAASNRRPGKADIAELEALSRLIRYYCLVATTNAGSGHPTSALSAVELMAGLMFGGAFRYFTDDPRHPNNDRLIFSKGHASPLFYSLWAAAGELTEEDLLTYRKFGSPLEGHPTPAFRHTVAATGSLGQGLSIGVGLALNAKYIDKLPCRTFVLLGDSEMSEGSQWEAIQIAAHYGLDNLVGIIDVNRLGQRGETMYGHDLESYARRVAAFGWETMTIDGHSYPEVLEAYRKALDVRGRPAMIIARTLKGKGVSFVEDADGRHGKALSKEELERALKELGPVDKSLRGWIPEPEDLRPEAASPGRVEEPSYDPARPVATRTAYGNALRRIFPGHPGMVVLDAEISNSTMAEIFKEAYPERFFEMYIAEQNMAGVAMGLSAAGKTPFASTFAAFLTRAFDQIRMNQYSGPNIKYCGSHAGVSIGEDGPSQMGLEDLAMFRAVQGSTVLYPCDPWATERLVEEAASLEGTVYIRTTRGNTPVIYGREDRFPIGGCKVLRESAEDAATVIAAGITVHEALKAFEELKKEGISVRVVDLYSVKPLDAREVNRAAAETRAIVTVEDHVAQGGIHEAVLSALGVKAVPVSCLAVSKTPKSGKPGELLEFEGISAGAIAKEVRRLLG